MFIAPPFGMSAIGVRPPFGKLFDSNDFPNTAGTRAAKTNASCPSRVLGSVNPAATPETEKTGAGVKGLSPAPSAF
jgi:hypothetical protein